MTKKNKKRHINTPLRFGEALIFIFSPDHFAEHCSYNSAEPAAQEADTYAEALGAVPAAAAEADTESEYSFAAH